MWALSLLPAIVSYQERGAARSGPQCRSASVHGPQWLTPRRTRLALSRSATCPNFAKAHVQSAWCAGRCLSKNDLAWRRKNGSAASEFSDTSQIPGISGTERDRLYFHSNYDARLVSPRPSLSEQYMIAPNFIHRFIESGRSHSRQCG